MRKNLGAKPILYPMPVLILGSYDEAGNANAMNAAWGGISEEKEISICISEDHQTTKNILRTKAFTVSIADKNNVIAADYVGIVSGKKIRNKTEIAGWHSQSSFLIHAPLFDELPLALECRLKSYDEESCRLVGEIINISADERILTNGKIDLHKFFPITYDPVNHKYLTLGEAVGDAFSCGKKLL